MNFKGSAHIEHGTVAKNIEAILKLEEDDERRLPHLHRVSHKVGWFVGTTNFVIIQAAFVVLWVLWNASASQPFDPYPFPLLSDQEIGHGPCGAGTLGPPIEVSMFIALHRMHGGMPIGCGR